MFILTHFSLDHTAEVLENYRRMKENEIFNHVLFEERNKRAFLRKEERKRENLIGNYEQRFPSTGYLQNTNNPLTFDQLHISDSVFYSTDIIHKNLRSKVNLLPSSDHSEVK